MVLPSSPNSLSTNQINVELSKAGSTSITMNDEQVRDLFAGETTNINAAPYLNLSQISFSDGRGKEAPFRASISTNTNDLDVRGYLVSQGWDQSKRVVLTIDAGVTISTSGSGTGFYAFVIQGTFPKGIRVVNNGTIAGKGGPGGVGGGSPSTSAAALSGTAGGSGAAAIYVGSTSGSVISLVNNGIVAGGGGGGGAGGGTYGVMFANSRAFWMNGAGGGGGAGGTGGAGGSRGVFSVQSPIISGSTQPSSGSAGSSSAGGSGGSAGSFVLNDGSGGGGGAIWNPATAGGAGGGLGANGSQGSQGSSPFGQASFTTGSSTINAGAAGLAVIGTNLITYSKFGTVYGGLMNN